MLTDEKMKKVWEVIIKTNLKNVEEGKALTIPLAILNGEFKKVFKSKFGDSMRMLGKTPKHYQKKGQYYQENREKISQKNKIHYQKPKVKAYYQAYYQRKKLEKLKEIENDR